jgi:hypothetical protein
MKWHQIRIRSVLLLPALTATVICGCEFLSSWRMFHPVFHRVSFTLDLRASEGDVPLPGAIVRIEHWDGGCSSVRTGLDGTAQTFVFIRCFHSGSLIRLTHKPTALFCDISVAEGPTSNSTYRFRIPPSELIRLIEAAEHASIAPGSDMGKWPPTVRIRVAASNSPRVRYRVPSFSLLSGESEQ